MALLSSMFRRAAITGRPDQVHAWFADRQGGRWADQKVRAAFPTRPPDNAVRDLEKLHKSGAISDAEFQELRAGLR